MCNTELPASHRTPVGEGSAGLLCALLKADCLPACKALTLAFGWEMPRLSNSSGCFKGSSMTCIGRRWEEEQRSGRVACSPCNRRHQNQHSAPDAKLTTQTYSMSLCCCFCCLLLPLLLLPPRLLLPSCLAASTLGPGLVGATSLPAPLATISNPAKRPSPALPAHPPP